MSTYQTQRHMTCCTTGRTHSYSNFILCLFFYRMEPPSIIRVVLPFKLSWKNRRLLSIAGRDVKDPLRGNFITGPGSLCFNWQRCRNRIELDNYNPRERLTYHFHALNFDTFSSANQKSQNFPPLYEKTSKHCSSLVQQHALF